MTPNDPCSAPTQRIDGLDLLRGFALLGILLMNVQSFGLPLAAYSNPLVLETLTSVDRGIWLGLRVFADMKFMNLFSMLFGVGILIFCERAQQKQHDAITLHRARMKWLIVFGLVHAYLIWWGDILFTYALCGLLFTRLMSMSNRRMLMIASTYLLVGAVLMALMNYGMLALAPQEAMSLWQPSPDSIRTEVELQLDSWATRFALRFEIAFGLQFSFPFMTYWRVTGLMLIGVVLYRTGFLKAQLSTKTYMVAGFLCLILGTAISLLGAYLNVHNGFNMDYSFVFGLIPNYFGSVLTSISYAAFIMLLARSPRMNMIRVALRCVGKTAFSNYILQSLIGLFFFSVLGFYAEFGYTQLMYYVVWVWIIQIGLSIACLAYFKQGPLEAMWRRLTYRAVDTQS